MVLSDAQTGATVVKLTDQRSRGRWNGKTALSTALGGLNPIYPVLCDPDKVAASPDQTAFSSGAEIIE
jgi:hypothetical protein